MLGFWGSVWAFEAPVSPEGQFPAGTAGEEPHSRLRREGCEPKEMGRAGQGCTRGFLSCPAAVPHVTCCPLAPEQKGWSGGRETSPEIFEKFNLGRARWWSGAGNAKLDGTTAPPVGSAGARRSAQ